MSGTPSQVTRTEVGRRGREGGEARVVPPAEPRSYYGRSVIKEPVWTWEIPVYFFTGGLGGASATLAFAAESAGNRRLARRAWGVALAGLTASPALLISDLGRPERFLNMFRMFKLTSPMSVGSWVLTVGGTCTGLAAARSLLGLFPRTGRMAGACAAGLGPAISTYTAVLVSDTAIPAWHEARRELPFLFAGSAMASAGAAAAVLVPSGDAGPARRLAVAGAVLEGGATRLMENRLGELAEPYRDGDAARLARAAKALTTLGAALIAARGRRRSAAVAGGAAVLAGALLQRWAIFKAGFASARDPKYTVGPQRRRLDERRRSDVRAAHAGQSG